MDAPAPDSQSIPPRRAIIYVRVSTDEQKHNNSFSMQETDGRAYAAEHTMVVTEVIQDDCSGATLDRPGLNRLRELVEAEQVDAVIIWTADRLARRHVYIAMLEEEFLSAGVEVHYCDTGKVDAEDENGQLLGSIRGVLAENERLRIRKRLVRGRREKIEKQQKISGHGADAPFGYRFEGNKRDRVMLVNNGLGADGKSDGSRDEARIVRLIFDWYVGGVPVKHIQDRLNAMGEGSPILGRQAKVREMAESRIRNAAAEDTERRKSFRDQAMLSNHWSRSTIYKILKNHTYTGTFYHYRKKDGKRTDREAWIGVPVPAIIEQATFDAAQARLAKGRAQSQRRCRREYLLRGHIRCECGYSCGGMPGNPRVKRGYYECYSRKERGRKCAHPCTRAGDVDDAVWAWIETIVLDEDNLREGLRQQQEGAETERAKLDEMRAGFVQQRLDLEQQAARLLRAYTAGVLSLDELAAEKRQIESAKRAVEAELAEVDQRIASLTLSPQEVDELTVFAAEVRRKLADLSFASKRRVVELLNTHVVLKVVDGQRYAEVTCKLTLDQETLPVESSSRQAAKGTGEASTVSTPYLWAQRRRCLYGGDEYELLRRLPSRQTSRSTLWRIIMAYPGNFSSPELGPAACISLASKSGINNRHDHLPNGSA